MNKAKIKLLIVEDHPLSLYVMKALLSKCSDIDVVGGAEDGIVALEQVELLEPDLVLMDVGMPRMDGIQAARLIRKRHPSVRILMATSHEMIEDILDSFSAGAHGYLVKDRSNQRLLSAVRVVASGQYWLDKSIANKLVAWYDAKGLQASNPQISNYQEHPIQVNRIKAISNADFKIVRLIADGCPVTEINKKHRIPEIHMTDLLKSIFNILQDNEALIRHV